MTKKLAYSLWGVAVLLLFYIPSHESIKETAEFTRNIKKEFVISPTGTTSVSNKYGKVAIKTWNKDRVKIDVTIVVKAFNEGAAQKVFDRIDIAFSNSDDFVKTVTSIKPQKKGWWSGEDEEKVDYSINYEVFMPPTNNLDLSHRYGEIFVGAIQGKATINSKYANMKVDELGDDSEISLAYGNGAIGMSKDLKIDVSYSKLFIDKTRDTEIASKYTTVNITEAGNINCSTKYDDYRLGQILEFKNEGQYDNIEIAQAQSVEISSKYTQLKVYEVLKALDLDFKYGNADCRLMPSCSNVVIQGNYTDFNLGLSSEFSSAVEAIATYASIRYPNEMAISYEKEKDNEHEIRGQLGNNPDKGLIKARLSYGRLKMIYKE